MSFYGGVLLGMQMNSTPTIENNNNSLRASSSDINSSKGDDKVFETRVQAEVERRLAALEQHASTNKAAESNSNNNKRNNKRKGKDDNRPRRFPQTISKIASGAALIGKNEFLSNFDYGIPKPPSKREHESDPGKDDVLLLYGSTKALPDVDTGIVYTDETGSDTSLPHLSAQDATKNCGGLNVIFTETHGGLEQCIAIVGNYESYHIQRWLRIKPNSKLDTSLPLTPVGRGLQTNGMDKFSAPSDQFMLQNQALLETYFARLSETIETLTPLAKECAGSDNTVIVMVCNTGQSELLINFVCSAKARGFGDILDKLLVFATDKGVLDIAEGLGLRAFYDEKVSVMFCTKYISCLFI